MISNLRIGPETAVLLEGIEHPNSRRWAASMRRYGTRIAGWVSPSTTDADADGLPVFRTCAEALAATNAGACVSMVEPRLAADSILDAAESGIRLIVSLTAGVPLHDAMRLRRRIRELRATVIGSGSSGVAVPAARVKLGSIPDHCLAPGRIALVSASASLASEAGWRMAQCGLGQSLYIDAGSHVVKGTPMEALPALVEADAATETVVLLGTPRGTGEEDFAEGMQRAGLGKPVLAYVAGRGLPDGAPGGFWPPPGHPGAMPVAVKQAALEAAGAKVYNSLGALIKALR